MYRKLIKQNKTFLSIVLILFILLGLILYFGGKQIYEKEAQWQHGEIISQLLSGKQIIEEYFFESGRNLLFLKDLWSTKGYVNSNLESIHYRRMTKEIFYDFAKVYKKYSRITIIDSSGRETIRVDNKQDDVTVIVPDSDLQNDKNQYYFQEAMQFDKGQVYTSSLDLNMQYGKVMIPYVPLIRLVTPLFNSKNDKKGILVLDLYFWKVLELLPKNMFIQTEDGNIMSIKPDGSTKFNKSNYVFNDRSGWLYLSETETIHYSTVEFLPGKRFVVAMYHSHPLLKVALQRLMLVSMILFVLFLCLISIIGYINIVRFRELIGAQKAIISSLAELAERRDPETGCHLERTRYYALVLAKQLRKNKKYRKIITNEFIEDLYDAAPLHDIGKVGIRDSILLKESKLTDEEYEDIKEHVRIGKQVLQDAIDKFKLKQSFLIVGRNICTYHHEKYDGKGYPEGLKGEEIPLEARIFALCDAYDAIRSKRSYKNVSTHEAAVKKIESDSGKHFDPDIVDIFLKCEKEFLQVSFIHK
ncbi:MAG: phosphohydrolase [Candidatus Brocadia sp. WS118]|nr:MAG: phosphohydrolase [Candidatus Brocadia sp. WS118]